MKHCLAQVFSVGLPTRLPKRDFVGCPVVLQNQWMDHGDICSALFKVAYPDSPAWTSHRQAVGRLPLPHRRGHRRNAPGFCARTPRSAHESPDVSGRTWKASTRSVRFSSPASACRRPPPSCTARVYSSPPNRARSFSVRRFRRNSSAAMPATTITTRAMINVISVVLNAAILESPILCRASLEQIGHQSGMSPKASKKTEAPRTRQSPQSICPPPCQDQVPGGAPRLSLTSAARGIRRKTLELKGLKETCLKPAIQQDVRG